MGTTTTARARHRETGLGTQGCREGTRVPLPSKFGEPKDQGDRLLFLIFKFIFEFLGHPTMRTTTDTLSRVRFRDLLTWHVRTDGATSVDRTPAPSGWAAGSHLRHPPGLAPRLEGHSGVPRRTCVRVG